MHRCLEYCYTKLGRSTPHLPQSSIDVLNTTTPNLADLPSPCQSSIDALNTATPNMADLPPPSIKHRCLEYQYTKLGRSTPIQSSIDAMNTATPNLADLLTKISGKPLHQISVIYNTMHIYPWQINPSPPPIKHTSLENHYTKSVSYIAQCIYNHGRLTPPPPPIKHRSLENHYTK